MPKSLAASRTKVGFLAVKPANVKAPTATELNAAVDGSCAFTDADFKLGPVASETISEKALCDEFATKVPGPSNYEAAFTVFRYFDDQGKAVTTVSAGDIGDKIFQLLKIKGTEIWVVIRRTSKKYDVPYASGDEVEIYKLITDHPQHPTDMGAYLKRVIEPQVQEAEINAVVAT